MPDNRAWWVVSIGVSFVPAATLVAIWHLRSTVSLLPEDQLTSAAAVDEHLAAYAQIVGLDGKDASTGIATGVFIQSMEFRDTARIYIAGHIWMRFPAALPAVFNECKESCDGGRLPFIFADQVDTSGDITPELRYQKQTDRGNVCSWYFEATLRERFDYTQYPFDQKTVSVRLWTRELLRNVLLEPDLSA